MKMMKEEKDKYYKLLKDLPDVKAGVVFIWNGHTGEYEYEYKFNNFQELAYYFSEVQVKENKEWFEPCLFISADGEPVFEGDEFYFVDFEGISKLCEAWEGSGGYSERKYFKSRQKAEEYIESLKPKFKVGDIVVVIDPGQQYTSYLEMYKKLGFRNILHNKLEDNFGIYRCFTNQVPHEYPSQGDIVGIENDNNQGLINVKGIRLATNDEIIQYYEQQGWVKGTKVIILGNSTVINDLKVIDNLVYVSGNNNCWALLDSCELIKEPEFPKSWEELKDIKGYWISPLEEILYTESKIVNKNKSLFSTEKQAKSALAFAQLSQLVKAMNGGWEYEWSDKNLYNDGKHNSNKLWTVIRVVNHLEVNFKTTHFCHLVFKTKELAEFSLKHHRKLWEEYYEL